MTLPIAQALWAADALVDGHWLRDVRIDVGGDGMITAVTAGAVPAACTRLAGPVVPAMPNAHSHAFQRALAGRTGRRAGDDSFWTWRQAMFAFVARVDPDAFEAIAAQAYAEMAVAGYSAVAEFHYVHRDASGAQYADPAELSRRIIAAAERAGIALTLLPVFYAHGGFGGVPLGVAQRRFAHTVESFAALHASLAATAVRDGVVLGVAPHSLRAVTPPTLQSLLALVGAAVPVHIHAAEQRREVEACIAWSGLRPVQWLLQHAAPDARWNIVHATHTTDAELSGIVQCGATVVLAPTTEADLGDGTFAAERYAGLGGRIAIGSDSNTVIDPFQELRQLEYSQRLALERRNVMARDDRAVGQLLWEDAARAGARACGRATGVIGVGQRADLVVLDANEPALAALPPDALLDAAIFGPCRAPVRDLVCGGRQVVAEGRHVAGDEILRHYRTALARIFQAIPR